MYGYNLGVKKAPSGGGGGAVAPVNTVAPEISGSTTLGSTLTTTDGTWSGTPTPTFTYQWYRGASPISGATSTTYVTTLADSTANITCQVTATNSAGSATATSNTITLPSYAPVNTVAPVISGTAVVGQTLTTTNGTWTNSPSSYSYQWKRGATNIGTNSSTYTLVQADAGNTSNITCVVTATNSAGSANATSNQIAQILDATWNDFKTTLSITDSTINAAMNTYTITRKSISATASLGAYPMVGGTATTHSRNLYNPADTNTAKRVAWSGTITHNSNGVQGNGTNGFGDTFINQLNELPTNFTIIFYSRTNQIRAEVDLGAQSAFTNGIELATKWNDNNTYHISRGPQLSGGNVVSNTTGFFVFKRDGNTVTIKRNGVTLVTQTVTANNNFNGNMFLMARNNNNLGAQSFSSKQFTHFEFMNFATTNTQDTDLYNAILAKETALGRNV